MSKQTFYDGDDGVALIVGPKATTARSPVHVVYGGADRYSARTPQKLGAIARQTMASFARDASEFAKAIGIPITPDASQATKIFDLTNDKLEREAVEDFRIDFEDGYGFRSDDEEDSHARSAAEQLATAFAEGTITPFCGFRIKSLGPETERRAERTLTLFLSTLLERTAGVLPENFVVNLPKITDRDEVKHLVSMLEKIEDDARLPHGAIGVELMIETPEAIFDHKGRMAIPRIIKAARGRCRSIHFGAYDHTASLGIAARFQGLGHPAADLARQFMLLAAAPLGVRVSDSVTTELPTVVHRGDDLNSEQLDENRAAVHRGWRIHFDNVSRSMASGFYQSWDLHPNQLPARYAAVYAFFLEGFDLQTQRLRTFVERATQASMTGNVFDDAASARGLINYFERGISSGAFTAERVAAAAGKDISSIRAMLVAD
ncbi:MAG: DUF6986 family protein [Pyrinomonadaceae bacterium]